MTFTLQPTADDIVATELYRVAHSGAAKFHRWFWLSLAGFIGTLVVIDASRHGINPTRLALGALAMVIMIWVPSRQSLIWRIKQRVSRFPALVAPVEASLDDEGLELAAGEGSARVQKKLMWHAFAGLDTTPQHLFLRFAPGPTIVCLPRRGLPAEIEGKILERRR